MTPAAAKVLRHMREHAHITPLEAQATYRVFDLAGRILELRKFLKGTGQEIVTKFTKDALGKRYSRYVLQNSDVVVANDAPIETSEREFTPIPRDHALVPYGKVRNGAYTA